MDEEKYTKKKETGRNMKLERHAKILELIGRYEVETQEELADLLKSRSMQ